jgi:homoserine kinase type II
VGGLVAPPGPGGGTANANLKILTASGAYFLKRRNPKYAQESFVAFDHALMEHLAPYAVATPLAVVSDQGRRWLRLGDDVYELLPYHRGGPHDRHSLAQLASAGRALARFHRAAREFSPPSGKDWPRYDDPRLIREGIEAIAGDLGRALSADEFGYLMAQVALLERELPQARYHALPKLVVHGDYHPGNLKFADDLVSGIFDLDWATLQPRLRDLADGIVLFAGERSSDIAGEDIFSLTQTWTPSLSRGRVFMEAYLESESVGDEEVAALPLFVRARWLYCRAAGMAKVAPERRVEYFTAGLLEPLRALDRLGSLS